MLISVASDALRVAATTRLLARADGGAENATSHVALLTAAVVTGTTHASWLGVTGKVKREEEWEGGGLRWV
jgi:hypothetical protein